VRVAKVLIEWDGWLLAAEVFVLYFSDLLLQLPRFLLFFYVHLAYYGLHVGSLPLGRQYLFMFL
jgi:hypothetical protein